MGGRSLAGSVVVVTGAASGIGRATALELAEQGAKLVLSGRRQQPLDELVGRCEQLGGTAIAHAADVTDEGAVQGLARRAVEHFGRIDAWVNNAAVTLFGRFDEVPPDAFRRVIDVNLFGYVHGSRAVLPYFREQGRGVLINVSSIVGEIAQPYTSPYVTSKWAVRGFSESLRMELALDDAKDIHVCTVLPASIDTPFFQHGANYTGRKPKPMRPIYDAEDVARTIAGLITNPRREAMVGGAGQAAAWQRRLAPSLAEATMARQVDMDHFTQEPEPRGPGNLWQPQDGHDTIGGGWKVPAQTGGAMFAMASSVVGLASVAGFVALRIFRRREQQRQDGRRRRHRQQRRYGARA